MTARYPRLAGPNDLLRIAANDDVRFTWPPTGTTATVIAFPEPWTVVRGDATEGGPQTLWVTNLATVTGLDGEVLEAFVRASSILLDSAVLAGLTSMGHYPVVLSMEVPGIMQWIRSIFRGTLASGVEDFQWKVDWGNPGNDPQLGEAEAGAFAEFLRDQWAAAFLANNTGTSLKSRHPTSVKYTEVGVAAWTQNAAKNADGSGGDAAQDYPAAWSAYDVGAQPAGSAVGACLPLETSCAVTFQTNKRGPRGRGRIYLPPFDVTAMTVAGTYSTAFTLAAGEAIGDLFDVVKSSSYAYKPIVVSMREKALTEIEEINVGVVPDSQRRRRRSQAEARAVAWTST